MKRRFIMGVLCAVVGLASAQAAEVLKVQNAWVRATAPGQKVAGAFMDITADKKMKLVAAESPASKVVELHTMRMEEGVMIMRQMKEIELPAGKAVNLKPGGLHVMLIDLNGPIKEGSKTPITLVARDDQGNETRVTVNAEARAGGMR